MSSLAWGEPKPIPNDHIDIQTLVIRDIESRRQHGIAKYGTALQPFNGRDALKDAYEEALDLACYLKQRLVEVETASDAIQEAVDRIRSAPPD